MTEYCVCSHNRFSHVIARVGYMMGEAERCEECLENYVEEKTKEQNWWHNFKEDNLSLIERLAKERKLV